MLIAKTISYFLIYFIDFQIWEGIVKLRFSLRDEKKVTRILTGFLIILFETLTKTFFDGNLMDAVRSIITYVGFFIYVLVFYRCTVKKTLICLSLYVCLSLTIEYVVLLMGYVILADHMSVILKSNVPNIVLSFIVKFIDYALLLLFKKSVPRLRGFLHMKDIATLLYISTIFIIVSNSLYGTQYLNDRAFAVYALGAVLVIISLVTGFIVVYAVKKKKELEYREEIEFIDAQLKLSNAMHEDMEKMLELREQMKENLCSLGVMLENGENEKALSFLKSLIPDTENNILDNLQSTMLSVILFEKKLKAERRGITMEVKVEVNDLIIPPNELNSIIGNMIENAIEACEKVKKKEDRKIDFLIFIKEQKAVIECRNTYTEKPIYENGVLVSSKMDNINHGYGVSTINYYVEKNNGTMKIRFGKNIFVMIAEFDETIAQKGAIPYI